MTYQKVVSKSLFLNPSKWVHILRSVCWMSIKILASKFPDVMGTYRRLSYTSKLHFLVSTFLSTMSDVNDFLLVLTFGNCVLKAGWLSGLQNYTYVFFTFLTFFHNPKTWLSCFFELLHMFSRALQLTLTLTLQNLWSIAHLFPKFNENSLTYKQTSDSESYSPAKSGRGNKYNNCMSNKQQVKGNLFS